MRRTVMMILLVPTLIAGHALAAGVAKFRLNCSDVRYVSVSPTFPGDYDVVIQLFEKSQGSLARVTRENIGGRVAVYINNTFIQSYPVKISVTSGMIGVGRYKTIKEAASRLEYILTVLTGHK